MKAPPRSGYILLVPALVAPLRRPLVILREIVIAILAYMLYFLVRGLTEGDSSRAFSNAADIVRLERWLRIFHEERLQSWAGAWEPLLDVLNAIYIGGHWPLIAAVAVWLLLARPAQYRLIRNAFLISGGLGLIVFATFPVAPPRLLADGFADTITQRAELYRTFQPAAFVNEFAAMPSLHFGWNLLIGIALVHYTRSNVLHLIGIVSPVAMAAAVILTANHFFLDVVAGAALALLGLWLAHLLPPLRVGSGADRGKPV